MVRDFVLPPDCRDATPIETHEAIPGRCWVLRGDMKSIRSHHVTVLTKAPTGITGFDEITGGGLPRNCSANMVFGSGSGKTIFALQFLVNGAEDYKEPGIFVSFEETAERIVANAEGLGWNLAQLRRKKLYFMDAQPTPDLVQSGDFDLNGMCAALEAKAKGMGARRIVFDALDVVLERLPDPAAKRREVYRLHEWLLAREMTGVITSKNDWAESGAGNPTGNQTFGFMQFMVDCAVILNQSVVQGLSQRNLRVMKYRGSGFDEKSHDGITPNAIWVALRWRCCRPVGGQPSRAFKSPVRWPIRRRSLPRERRSAFTRWRKVSTATHEPNRPAKAQHEIGE